MGLFSSSSGYLGVDIGASGVKIVELKNDGSPRLVSYGFSENKAGNTRGDWKNDVKHAAEVVKKVCKESGMASRNAVAALPTFSVFSSVINLFNIQEKDLAGAVRWEAKKVIPLPLEEMILDWKKVEETTDQQGKTNVKVLLTGAPKSLVKTYMDIFRQAEINLVSLETETFSLIRSLLGHDKATVMLVEIGAYSTDISMVSGNIPLLSRSIDVGGINITRAISKNLGLGLEEAEQFKYDLGMAGGDFGRDAALKKIEDSISPIVNEIRYTLNLFENKNNKTTEKIVLSGGSVFLNNLVIHLSEVLNKKVIIGDPWFRVSYPAELTQTLKEIAPRMSIAVGLALREIE